MIIKYIESSKNQYLKNYRKLKQKKWREKLGLVPIEGINLIWEAIKRGINIEYIIFSSRFEEYGKSSEVLEALEKFQIPCFKVKDDIFRKTAFTENPQGILACIKHKNYSLVDILNTGKDIVFVSKLQDPGNLGTLMRTAEAFEWGGLILGRCCVDPGNDKVVRSSMGSVLDLPVYKELQRDEKELLSEISKWDYKFIAAQPKGEIKSYNLPPGKHPICLIIGHEVEGVAEDIYTLTNIEIINVEVPISSKVDSLNAAIAGSILMYEVSRNRIYKGF